MEQHSAWDGHRRVHRGIYILVEHFKDWYRFIQEKGKTKAGWPTL